MCKVVLPLPSFLFPSASLSLLSSPSPFFPLEVNTARSLGSAVSSPSRVWDSPSRNRFWCILALKSDIWWHQFYYTDLNNSEIRYTKKLCIFVTTHLVCLRHWFTHLLVNMTSHWPRSQPTMSIKISRDYIGYI